MADRDYVPQWVRDFRRLEEQENIAKTKRLLEESVKLQKETADTARRAAREEEERRYSEERRYRREEAERRRVASLPKCPECQTPLEGKRPRRCAACRSDVFWILNTPLGVRGVTQTFANPAGDPLIVEECNGLEIQLGEYRSKRRELLGFPWLPNPNLSAEALFERAHQVASTFLEATSANVEELRRAVQSYYERRDGISRQLSALKPRLEKEERALVGLFVWWGGLCLLYGVGIALTPFFLFGWWIIRKKQDALRVKIHSLTAKLEDVSRPENTGLIKDFEILNVKLKEAKNGSTMCLRAEDSSDLYGLVNWTEWRDSLVAKHLRRVFDAITCIVAVNRLMQASERANGLFQDVNALSRELGHQSPPEIPTLNELLAGFSEMLAGGPVEEPVQTEGYKQTADSQQPAREADSELLNSASGVDDVLGVANAEGPDAFLISDALTLLAAADRQVTAAEIQAMASTLAKGGVVLGDEDHIKRVKQAVEEIKAKGVTVFANSVRDRLLPHRGTQFIDNLLKAMVDVSERDGAVHENETRVIEWFRQQLAIKAP